MGKNSLTLLGLLTLSSLSFAQTDSISTIAKSEVPILLTSKEVALRLENCKEIDVSQLDDCTYEKTIAILVKHLQYPAIAREMELEGTVYVQFVVDENGDVGKWEIIKSSSPHFNKEVKQAFSSVIHQLKFIPPVNLDGEKVEVSYTLPIRFRLD